MPALATSIFSRKPSDLTIVADVYAQNKSQVVNSFQDQTQTAMSISAQFSFLSKYASGSALSVSLSGVANITNTAVGTVAAATASIGQEASAVVGGVVSAGGSAVSVAMSASRNAITGLTNAAADVYVNIGGSVQVVAGAAFSSLNSLSKAVGSMLGNVGVGIGINASGAFGNTLAGLSIQASNLGIRGSFGIMASCITGNPNIGNPQQALYQLCSSSLSAYLSCGDVGSVASMSVYLGIGGVSMLNPSAVSRLMMNDTTSYTNAQITGSNAATDPESQFQQYKANYAKIDPNWNVSDFKLEDGAGPFFSFDNLLHASSQVKKIFIVGGQESSDTSDEIYAFLGGFTGTYTVQKALAASFPDSPAANSSNLLNKDTDPRINYTAYQ